MDRNVRVDALIESDWEVGLCKRSVAKTRPWQKRPDKPLLTVKLERWNKGTEGDKKPNM